MCGIAGFFEPGGSGATDALLARVRRMADTLAHRGPDDRGEWADAAAGIALGFRRLSIQDLSPLGHQPMASADGRWTIIFNGEVYNFKELRTELEAAGARFKGGSDTEVILAAVNAWGLEPAVRRFVGMFAIALWDGHRRELHLVRDRIGIKPLYWAKTGNGWVFGSELKALRAHPDLHPEVDRDALALYLAYDYIESPRTIWSGVAKLPPGTIVTLREGDDNPAPRAYWSLRGAVEQGLGDPFTGSDEEAEERLHALLRESIRLRMIADVPVGAFLSGGVDSTLVVALMQAVGGAKVKTFTIGFEEAGYDESAYARAAADRLGTEHTERRLTPAETMAIIPKLPEMFDEPFADVSQIPTYLVSRLARERVTVTLSGEGGDELFGGYGRYWWSRKAARLLALPRFGRAAVAGAVRAVPSTAWDALLEGVGRIAPGAVPRQQAGEKMMRFAKLLATRNRHDLYREMLRHGTDPAALMAGTCAEPPILATDASRWPERADFDRWMRFVDASSFLSDDILVKTDRATMAVSLEGRVPLLDHRIVEFAWRLPRRLLQGDRQGKVILRRIAAKYVPASSVTRPKQGFTVPIGNWLRADLRDWAEALLDETRLRREGFLNPASVRAVWADHLSGKRDRAIPLWNLLMFQAWLERQPA